MFTKRQRIKLARILETYHWLMVAVLIVGLVGIGIGQWSAQFSQAQSISTSKLVRLVNNYRTQNGLSKLDVDAKLKQAAQAKATEMLEHQYFSHISPVTGKRGIHTLPNFGYKYLQAGENLAAYYESEEAIMEAWKQSATHNQNLLRKEFTETGIAAVPGKYKGYATFMVVQFLANPEPKGETSSHESPQKRNKAATKSAAEQEGESDSNPTEKSKQERSTSPETNSKSSKNQSSSSKKSQTADQSAIETKEKETQKEEDSKSKPQAQSSQAKSTDSSVTASKSSQSSENMSKSGEDSSSSYVQSSSEDSSNLQEKQPPRGKREKKSWWGSIRNFWQGLWGS